MDNPDNRERTADRSAYPSRSNRPQQSAHRSNQRPSSQSASVSERFYVPPHARTSRGAYANYRSSNAPIAQSASGGDDPITVPSNQPSGPLATAIQQLHNASLTDYSTLRDNDSRGEGRFLAPRRRGGRPSAPRSAPLYAPRVAGGRAPRVTVGLTPDQSSQIIRDFEVTPDQRYRIVRDVEAGDETNRTPAASLVSLPSPARALSTQWPPSLSRPPAPTRPYTGLTLAQGLAQEEQHERLLREWMHTARAARASNARRKPTERDRIIRELEAEDERNPSPTFSRSCAICLNTAPNSRAVFTACGHAVCRACALKMERDAEKEDDTLKCPTCRAEGGFVTLFEDRM